MNEKYNLTTGNVKKTMLIFVLPYLLSCFLQTFYGMADLFVVGLYNGSETTTAVSIGSQVMHMLTVMLVGLAMGTTVELGHCVGAKDPKRAKETTGTTICFFALLAAVLTVLTVLLSGSIVQVMMTPAEAVSETRRYLMICFIGLPFIIAYNVISSVYRGMGDSKSPMVFIGIACMVNIVLDFVFIGGLKMGAAGAALGTVIGQGCSVMIALLRTRKMDFSFSLSRKDLRIERRALTSIVKVGVPICMQDGLIQVAFIVITAIANSRGLIAATSVGIVEKVISFLFLVPSAFLSAISAITAQNMGAGKARRAKQSLAFGLWITVSWGILCCVISHLIPETMVGIFTKDAAVMAAGGVYLRAYSFDCIFAAMHFCFSGYFCGDQKSGISFLHNILSILVFRIPGAYLASKLFPETLYPMGLAAPAGSAFSALICIGFFVYYQHREKKTVS